METSVANLKSHLSQVLSTVKSGEVYTVLKHNKPVAILSPYPEKAKNQTQVGCGLNTAQVLGDLTEPMIPSDNWDMLR